MSLPRGLDQDLPAPCWVAVLDASSARCALALSRVSKTARARAQPRLRGRILVSLEDRAGPRRFDAATGAEQRGDPHGRRALRPAERCSAAAFARDGTRVATAHRDDLVRLRSVKTGELLRTLAGHAGTVRAVAFSADGALLATASDDATANLWDILNEYRDDDAPARTLAGHADWVRGVAFGGSSSEVVGTASDDGTAAVWDTATGALKVVLAGHAGYVRGLAFAPDAARVATASWDCTARVWNVADGAVLAVLTAHSDLVAGCAWAPDGARLATCSFDATACLWDVAPRGRPSGGPPLLTRRREEATPSSVVTLRVVLEKRHEHTLTGCAFSTDSKRLLTSSYDRTVRVWDASDGTPLGVLRFDAHVYACDFAPLELLQEEAASKADVLARRVCF
mmetsp:Transcript_25825/g.103165  ORF Transcript_25825/g.103165 Transcript_25825/m.103165 type:complete len:397 (+) Transcript_25825:62-1252(+)